jgi:hypothetical protein
MERPQQETKRLNRSGKRQPQTGGASARSSAGRFETGDRLVGLREVNDDGSFTRVLVILS